MTARTPLPFWMIVAAGLVSGALAAQALEAAEIDRALALRWDKELLSIRGKHLPGGSIEVWDIESFCRPGSTRRDWKQTIMPHTTKLVEAAPDGQMIKLQSRLSDGVIVEHEVRAGRDQVEFAGQERKSAARDAGSPAKKLIEFGWDVPDTGFLRKQRAQLEKSPFDGCVFQCNTRTASGAVENFTWLCWGRGRFAEADFQQAIDDLKAIPAGSQFRHNFLRFNVTPADLDWFDDYSAVTSNARMAARVARAGRSEGILFDTEAYQSKLFDFHKQRDSARRSWSDYANQARLRGREVMSAFQEGLPDLTVLVTFGHSFVWKQSDGGKKPLADCPDGLLVPFLDGMVAVAKGKARFIDGHEMSYGYREAGRFAQAHEAITRKAATLAADRGRYRDLVSAGFGLWLDYDWPKFGWNTRRVESNYFSPERFESSLRAAIEQSDEYVWIYNEKPRWWSEKGSTIDLPPAYVEAVRRVRRALLAEIQ